MSEGCLEQWKQCGAVRPFWVDIGWVRWAGSPEREKMYNIVYLRCKHSPLPPVILDDFTYYLCPAHLKEMTERSLKLKEKRDEVLLDK